MDLALVVIVWLQCYMDVFWISGFINVYFLFFTRTPHIPVSPHPSEQNNNRVVVETSLLWNRTILQDPQSSSDIFKMPSATVVFLSRCVSICCIHETSFSRRVVTVSWSVDRAHCSWTGLRFLSQPQVKGGRGVWFPVHSPSLLPGSDSVQAAALTLLPPFFYSVRPVGWQLTWRRPVTQR